jgi:class 3 adenylate cyclase
MVQPDRPVGCELTKRQVTLYETTNLAGTVQGLNVVPQLVLTIELCEGWDYGAIGTVTNLAARLCGDAKAGQILISRRVLSSVADQIEAEFIGELQLKGFAKEISVFNVTALKI